MTENLYRRMVLEVLYHHPELSDPEIAGILLRRSQYHATAGLGSLLDRIRLVAEARRDLTRHGFRIHGFRIEGDPPRQ